MSEIEKLDIDDAISLIIKAYEKQSEQRAWELYLATYPNYTEETYKTFDEFYIPPQKRQKEVVKSETEILQEVKQILDSMGGVGNRDI